MVDPIVVIGGGLAGTAAAIELARSGRCVTVLERENLPHHKICGEFLSVEACQDLDRLGLSAEGLGGVPIDRVRVHHGSQSIEAPLPFLARGLSRLVLDEALLNVAAQAGATVMRGVRVTGASSSNVAASNGHHAASHVLLASGKHDLRGHGRPQPSKHEGYLGFKMHWRLPPDALAQIGSATELVLLGKGYAGLQRVGCQDANLCLVINRANFMDVGGTWDALLSSLLRNPALAARLGDAEPLFARPLTIANLPYGYIHSAPAGKSAAADDIWRLGDQAAMTASLTGDGMAIALRSGRLAATAIAQGANAEQFHRQLRAQTHPQIRAAMRLQRWSERPALVRMGMIAGRLCPAILTRAASHTRLPRSFT